jgi:hypothetical protein
MGQTSWRFNQARVERCDNAPDLEGQTTPKLSGQTLVKPLPSSGQTLVKPPGSTIPHAYSGQTGFKEQYPRQHPAPGFPPPQAPPPVRPHSRSKRGPHQLRPMAEAVLTNGQTGFDHWSKPGFTEGQTRRFGRGFHIRPGPGYGHAGASQRLGRNKDPA